MAGKTSSIYPELQQDLTLTSCGSTICSYSYQADENSPIAVLIHGYPQSAYLWRYLIPALKPHCSLFIPELPGYGVSSLPSPGQHSKRAVGTAILEALTTVFNIQDRKSASRKVILIGHDRGARISHRLAVDKYEHPGLEIASLILIDIVPTKVQWDAFANPQAGVAYFHWPFLANVELATKMIEAYGGDNWCLDILTRGQGSSPDGQASFVANGAVEVYAANFKKRDAILGSCEDYHCGSMMEANEQAEDTKAGRKVTVPTMVIFSAAYLGEMHDVAGAWKDWIEEGVTYEAVGIGGGKGHYLPEEDPEQVNKLALDWMAKRQLVAST